jgi:hypothetical protein
MRRNAPGAREQRTGGDEEEKGREGRNGTSDVGRATTTTTKRRGLVAVSRHNNQIKVAWVVGEGGRITKCLLWRRMMAGIDGTTTIKKAMRKWRRLEKRQRGQGGRGKERGND